MSVYDVPPLIIDEAIAAVVAYSIVLVIAVFKFGPHKRLRFIKGIGFSLFALTLNAIFAAFITSLGRDNHLGCAGRPARSKWCKSTAMKV